jgi:multiple antibiotic resistance protein
MTLLNVSIILFLIMDPFGNVSSFLSLLQGIEPKKQKTIVLREMLIALAVMITFYFIGEYIFSVLNVSETTLRLTTGVILFLVAIKILFPSIDSLRANLPKGEPFITPLAIPLIAGPSLLATIMLFSHLENSQPIMLTAIFISWAAAVAVLFASSHLQRFFGANGLMACERLMGMILILVAIQRFLEGVQQFVKDCQ